MEFVGELEETELDVDELRGVLEEHLVELGVLFGSYARGDASILSDLDLALKLESVEDKSRVFDRLTADIVRELGVEAVDLVDLEDCPPGLGYEILRQGVVVIGEESRAREMESRFFQLKTDFERVRQEWREALHGRIEAGDYGKA